MPDALRQKGKAQVSAPFLEFCFSIQDSKFGEITCIG
jgi:hypothetical protein